MQHRRHCVVKSNGLEYDPKTAFMLYLSVCLSMCRLSISIYLSSLSTCLPIKHFHQLIHRISTNLLLVDEKSHESDKAVDSYPARTPLRRRNNEHRLRRLRRSSCCHLRQDLRSQHTTSTAGGGMPTPSTHTTQKSPLQQSRRVHLV